MSITKKIKESYYKYDDYFQTILSARELGLGPKEFYESTLFKNWNRRNAEVKEGVLEHLIGYSLADAKLWMTHPLGALDITRYLGNRVMDSLNHSK